MNDKKRLLGPVAIVFDSAHTGAWRILRPVVNPQKCTFCGECQKYCPADAVEVRKDEKVLSVDLYYCKGCGICVEICPQRTMTMEPERKKS
jgi:2-oxoacid:acceptor oxidoreductase delta subunit (pyruvate/2-ketoisovalerate family)